MKTLFKALWCVITHWRYWGDDTWEVVGLPTSGLSEKPALWRTWRHCCKCGRGWTRRVTQVGPGKEISESWTPRDKPLPEIRDASFSDPTKSAEVPQ